MEGKWFGIIWAAVAAAASIAAPASARADLPTRFLEEQKLDPNSVPIRDDVEAAVQARPIVMIAGFLNEWMPEYFRDNLDTLYEDFGQKEIHRFYPSSNSTAEENTPLVDG